MSSKGGFTPSKALDKTLTGVGDLVCQHMRIGGKMHTWYFTVFDMNDRQPDANGHVDSYMLLKDLDGNESRIQFPKFVGDKYMFLVAQADCAKINL